jgi:P pilus assembly chaperone PapD
MKTVKEDSHFMALLRSTLRSGIASQVRIVKQAATSALPKDENRSLFQPARSAAKKRQRHDERSVMQVAMQSRIKLFWRPKAIVKKAGDRRKCAWR